MVDSAKDNSNPCMIVPAYNEASRIEIRHWSQILEQTPYINWIFVDDGSQDQTVSILQELKCHQNFSLIEKAKNEGKAEAVRTGILSAPTGTTILGFTDCDKAFDANELVAFLNIGMAKLKTMNSPYMIIASRVKLAGRSINRSTKRHLVGRVIATLFGFIWRDIPYDTQSGLKLLLLPDRDYKAIFASTFKTKWLFDMEIIDRMGLLGTSKNAIEEVPLRYWTDVSGSKITAREYPRIMFDISRIALMVYKRFLENK